MTDYQPTSGGDDVHALSGAYAVDALEPDERARFEAHLRQCADCRDEVDSLREAAAVLGTDDVAPPAALRDRLLSDITNIRPLPPLPVAPVVQLDSRRRPGARIPLLVAAAAVLIAGVGGAIVRPWADETQPDLGPPTAEQVLAAADATSVEKRFPDGAEATVVVSRSLHGAVIQTENMRAAPTGKDYQLWLQTPAGVMEPAGLMPDLRDATVLLDGDPADAVGVGITVEPDGGSERPTSEPIAVFALDS
ncbi:anti-sigma factor [Nocardioides sp. CPCC 206347]|uniref:anti-sigma factor n=1 Tax=Nocardioides sp. CPCC 206347 TaxID=3406463 RepID=UPI003B42AE12